MLLFRGAFLFYLLSLVFILSTQLYIHLNLFL